MPCDYDACVVAPDPGEPPSEDPCFFMPEFCSNIPTPPIPPPGPGNICQATICVTATPTQVPTEDSVVTCNTISPTAPVGPNGPINVGANVQQGQQQQGLAQQSSVLPGQQSYLLNSWMYQQFQTGGDQDYKNQPWGGSDYADFGNFNYGAVCGSVGFGLAYCQSAAGVGLIGRVARLGFLAGFSQSPVPPPMYNGQGIPFITSPFGDQPGDSTMIAQGFGYQAQGCSN